jgi:hypothetical protein
MGPSLPAHLCDEAREYISSSIYFNDDEAFAYSIALRYCDGSPEDRLPGFMEDPQADLAAIPARFAGSFATVPTDLQAGVARRYRRMRHFQGLPRHERDRIAMEANAA